MNIKTVNSMGLAALMLLATACSSDDSERSPQGAKEIRLSAQVDDAATRAATYERIYTNATVWVWADVTDGTSVTEADFLKAWQLNANANGTLTPASDDKKTWPDVGNLDFYTLVGNFADGTLVKNTTAFPTTALTHTIAADQTDEAAYNRSDLLYGQLAAVTSDDYPTLILQHQLVQVQVALIAGGDITKAQLAGATVELVGQPTTATITLSKTDAPVVAAGSETAAIKLSTVANDYEDTYLYGRAVIAPGEASGHFVKITFDSNEYYYDLNKTLESGNTYRLQLMLKDKAVISLSDATLTDWTAGGDPWE